MNAKSILDTIGHTPLVEIRTLNPNPAVKIMAKLEYFNPGGSIKDRPALHMIEAGEASGELTHEKIVIEATSGNTGIGLALVCSVKGYKLKLAMSEAVSVERRKILQARGAEIILTPGHLGTDGAIEEVKRLYQENPGVYFMSNQYNNAANWQSHYFGTAEELWAQTHGEITMLVATMGTTGTLMGLSRRLKELNPQIRIIGVEPYLGHKIQGLKNMKEAYEPQIYERVRLDEKINIEDDIAFDMTRRLAKDEGLFVGMSSGAALAVAVRQAEKMDKGTLVVIFPDGGERYLSTPVFAVQDIPGPMLYNTMSHSEEQFVSSKPGEVSMYSCGPTVHDRMHIGVCRRFVFADLLCRYLRFRGFQTTHIINITDLDDKTILGAQIEGCDHKAFTDRYLDLFQTDMNTLGILPATQYPRVSEHLMDMISLGKELVEKKMAYEKQQSLYFDISGLEDYGSLSRIDLDKIRLGLTVDLGEYEKENPRDFTLFKKSPTQEIENGVSVSTEWGPVRPSLHIQCAAIAMKYLGKNFDIHTSSRELVFPHHENEQAICRALYGKPLASYWIHCDRVLLGGKKVDEKDNRLTLDQVLDMGFTGREIRFWMLGTHYRRVLHFSEDRLLEARRSLRKVDGCIQALLNVKDGRPYPELDQIVYDIKHGFIHAMNEDLNISAAMASMFSAIRKLNLLVQEQDIDPDGAREVVKVFRDIDEVFNAFDFHDLFSDELVVRLMEKREKARAAKDWERADRIRGQLEELGVSVRDVKNPNGM
ncbi:MAG: cysteine synthase [Proteobacteria bacterium]|nr:cysteine synthase [Pseudomonadota bacterium]